MNVTPPTPEGKQEATHDKVQVPSHQLPVLSLPLAAPKLLLSSADNGNEMEVDDEPSGAVAASSIEEAITVDPNDTPSDNRSEINTYSPPSSVANSLSRGAASGRWKDTTIEASHELYQNVDATLRSFSEQHGVSFTRTVKGYLKHHGLKLGGDNCWTSLE